MEISSRWIILCLKLLPALQLYTPNCFLFLTQVAYELMDKMDLHIGLNKGDMAYIQLFNSM